MAEPTPQSTSSKSWQFIRRIISSTWFYFASLFAVALITFVIMLLWQNINERKREARQTYVKLVEIDENTIDPALWGKNFPRQYDSYKRTVDIIRTRHGGSEAIQKLNADPRWRTIFEGYPFAVDYREERGHAYMLSDQRETERVRLFKQPGACLHCHASIIPAYRQKGREAGVPDADPHAQMMKGFALVNSMKFADAQKMVDHPVACIDCHDPDTMQLRVTRPAFLNAMQTLANSKDPLPHLISVERWRKEKTGKPYDVNKDATRQEMRSLVCAQCHVEYHFKGKQKMLTYPWSQGLKAEQIEAHYDKENWKDWQHPRTGANALKAQHPEFELWSQGIHARSGVACADCHMPYQREGAIKVSDHHIRSPLLNIARACQNCHRYPEEEIKSRAEAIQDRTHKLLVRGEEATLALINAVERARKSGVTDAQLKTARDLHRKAQWRLDFIAAENSMGFHAPQEAARVLAEAIDYARQGQVEATRFAPNAAMPGKAAGAQPKAAG